MGKILFAFILSVTSYSVRAQTVAFQGSDQNSLEEAIAVEEQQSEPDISELAGSYLRLANLYEKSGAHEKMLEALKNALGFKSKLLGENHFDLAAIYGKLAFVYKSLGDFGRAEKALLKELAIRHQPTEESDPGLALGYHHLAEVYVKQNKLEQALVNQQQAIALFEKVAPPDHPSLAVFSLNLSRIHYAMHDLDEAISSGEKAFAGLSANFPSDHPHVEQSRDQLAIYYEERGRQKQNVALHEEALLDYQKVLKYRPDIQQVKSLVRHLEKSYPKVVLTSAPLSEKEVIPVNPKPVPASKPVSKPMLTDQPRKTAADVEEKLDREIRTATGEFPIRDLLSQKRSANAERMALEQLGKEPDNHALRILYTLAILQQGQFEKARGIWFIFKKTTLSDGQNFSVQLLREIDALGPQNKGVVAKFKKMVAQWYRSQR